MQLICKDKCTGCTTCFNICPVKAITLYENEEGFFYPSIDQKKCIECSKCVENCPELTTLNIMQKKFEKIFFAFQVQDKYVLKNSSSGGFFSAISNTILNSNGSVFGAAYDKNLMVKHIEITKHDELMLLQGSKYVQSDLGSIFKQVEKCLLNGKIVLFSGTSCQIAGLTKYLNMDYSNLVTIDLVCHGVPSPKVFSNYINYIENKFGQIKSYSFRSKDKSWHLFNTRICFQNIKKDYIGKWNKDPFYRGFLRELFLRPSCHVCKYSNTDKPADITIGDFWGYKRHKELIDKDVGISMVMINTFKGKKIFDTIDKSVYNAITVSLQEAVNGNHALKYPFPPSPLRSDFWQDFHNRDFDYIIKKYLYPENLSISNYLIYLFGRYPLILDFFNKVLCVIIRFKNILLN